MSKNNKENSSIHQVYLKNLKLQNQKIKPNLNFSNKGQPLKMSQIFTQQINVF